MTAVLMPISDALVEQAAQWIVLLTDDDATERERARSEFEAWKQADPRHAAAAADMEQLLGRIRGVREQAAGNSRLARAALESFFGRTRRRAKRVGASLAILLALAAPVWLALQTWPPAYLMADLRTSAGEWKIHILSDGTRLTVGSIGAVNLRYDEHRRTVELVQGEILVDVAKDAKRPFVVETSHGSIRALGTRFVVDHQNDATLLSMIESRVSVQTANQRATGDAAVIEVNAGQRLRITADAVSAAEAIDSHSVEAAWQQHQLVVSDRPLAEVLDRLARYRRGRLFYNLAQIDDIRVNAVLPLDDTDRALQVLLDSFPMLRIRTLTPYLVWVDVPPPEKR